MRKICFAMLLAFLVIITSKVSHAYYYGQFQYSFPDTGVTHLVFQKSETYSLCINIKREYIRGLRASCDNCVIEDGGCYKTLPDPYIQIFDNLPLGLPYLSAHYTRIVVFGVGIDHTIETCREMALMWERGMNQPARCIKPFWYKKSY